MRLCETVQCTPLPALVASVHKWLPEFFPYQVIGYKVLLSVNQGDYTIDTFILYSIHFGYCVYLGP